MGCSGTWQNNFQWSCPTYISLPVQLSCDQSTQVHCNLPPAAAVQQQQGLNSHRTQGKDWHVPCGSLTTEVMRPRGGYMGIPIFERSSSSAKADGMVVNSGHMSEDKVLSTRSWSSISLLFTLVTVDSSLSVHINVKMVHPLTKLSGWPL